MVKIVIACMLLVPVTGAAQEQKSGAKAPEISKDIAAHYFKAAAQQAQAQLVLDRAQKDFEAKTQAVQAVVSEMNKQCGNSFQPTLNGQGDPECIAKPKAPEPAKK